MQENILYILGEGGGRIPSKFIQQLKVGSGKEVATVHAAENGRKVSHRSISSPFALKKQFQVAIEFRGKTYTLSLSQIKKMVDGADKEGTLKKIKRTTKWKTTGRSKNKNKLHRVPM